jgi:hypothetical protein
MPAFQSGSTYAQYVPVLEAPDRLVLEHVTTWPNATAVLTRPATDALVRIARRSQCAVVLEAAEDRIFAARITVTGTLAPVLEHLALNGRSPMARIAYHRALSATSRDKRVKRILARNLKLQMAQIS